MQQIKPVHSTVTGPAPAKPDEGERFLGIDLGAETIKVVELVWTDGAWRWSRRDLVEHGKEPARVLSGLLRAWDWERVKGAAVSGRFSKQAALPRVPAKQAQARAFRFLADDGPGTVVSIGSHGFSV